MNTLSKNITRYFFSDQENGYNSLIARWSEYTNDPENRDTLGVSEHLLYAILRGKDWRKNFTPVTNSVKLANGADPNYARKLAFWGLSRAFKHPVFSGLLSPDAEKLIKGLLNVDPETEAYNGYAAMGADVAAVMA